MRSSAQKPRRRRPMARVIPLLMSAAALPFVACDDEETGDASPADAQVSGGQGGGAGGAPAGGSGGAPAGGSGGEPMAGAGGEPMGGSPMGGAGGAPVGGAGGEPVGGAGGEPVDMGPPPDAWVPPMGDCLLPPVGATEGLWAASDITQGQWTAEVEVDDADPCRRVFVLSSDLPRRDALPESPRVLDEGVAGPRMRTGHDLFDALYVLARREVEENAVDAIRDGAFREGQPVQCAPGGCFETGRKWNYVWTRDTAYAVDLGLAIMDPVRSANSLDFKLSERRGGGDLQIVQDTGSGGSYPISSDRVVWSIGARAALAWLDGPARQTFEDRAWSAAVNTLEHDREVVFDPADGLYRGEQSFLDWREQSYPLWVQGDVVHIGMSKALSTNVGHLSLMRLAAELGAARGEADAAARYGQWADALEQAIRDRLYLADEGQYSTFVTTGLDQAPARHFDLLGASLAILHGVATPEQARGILDGYPHTPHGPPVIWPQQKQVPIYHNRGLWPFVTAYWVRAAAMARHAAVIDHNVRGLMQGAALNLSNMENFEATTGLPELDDGPYTGPVVNSQRQLWSVAGYLAMVHDVVFGVQAARPDAPAALRFQPAITGWMRDALFGATERVVLEGLSWRGRALSIIVHLPERGAGEGVLSVSRVTVDGVAVGADAWLGADVLVDGAVVDVYLGAPSAGAGEITVVDDFTNYRDYFAPLPPAVTAVSPVAGGLQLTLDRGEEQAADVTFDIYRDGARVASGIAGDATTWVDAEAEGGAVSHCYTAELTYTRSGNTGQRSAPWCWWGPEAERITTVYADAFVAEGGRGVVNHGRFHFEGWGGPGHTLTIDGVSAGYTGTHLMQVTYGNGAGSVNTGVTCAVKWVEAYDVTEGQVVGGGYLVMPHLGDWARWEDSNFVKVDLEAGHTYRFTISGGERAINMSSFAHFEAYTGGLGGVGGAFNDVNIADFKLLSLSGRQ